MRRGTRGLFASAIAIAAMAALPAAASADTRYAAPDGDGADPCASSDPCEIEFAIEGASANDDVSLLGGVPPAAPFVLSVSVNVPSDVVVHGAPGARPVIHFPSSVGGHGLGLFTNSVLRDVDVDYQGASTAIQFFDASTIERVFSHSSGAAPNLHSPCFVLDDATISNSVCWYEPDVGGSIQGAGISGSISANENTIDVRNSTIFTTGFNPGVQIRTTGGEIAMNFTNSIVRSTNGTDVRGEALVGTEPIDIVLDHSNYASVGEIDPGTQVDITPAGTGTNQTTAPAFVDQANGDFHQTSSSAGTLNLGSAASVLPGELDLGGAARLQGSAPDIGAFEFAPPVVDPPVTNPPPPTTKKKCKKKKSKKRAGSAAKKKCKKKKKRK